LFNFNRFITAVERVGVPNQILPIFCFFARRRRDLVFYLFHFLKHSNLDTGRHVLADFYVIAIAWK